MRKSHPEGLGFNIQSFFHHCSQGKSLGCSGAGEVDQAVGNGKGLQADPKFWSHLPVEFPPGPLKASSSHLPQEHYSSAVGMSMLLWLKGSLAPQMAGCPFSIVWKN